jgi:hypothetical protein
MSTRMVAYLGGEPARAEGPCLYFAEAEWRGFLDGIKARGFDEVR